MSSRRISHRQQPSRPASREARGRYSRPTPARPFPARFPAFPASNAASDTAAPGSTTRPCSCHAQRTAAIVSSSLTARPRAPRALRMPKVIGDTLQRLDRVAKRRRRIRADRHDLAQLERAAHVVPALGLDRNDFGVGTGQRDARRKPAAAAIDQDPRRRRRSSLVQLVEDFQPDRPLPGDDVRIVVAGHDDRALLDGNAGGDFLAALGLAIEEDDFGALGARALDLQRGRVGRHDDGRRRCRAAWRRSPRPGHDCRMKRRRRPVSRSSSLSCISRLVAPLNLNEPPVCRHSHFSQTRLPRISRLDQRRALDRAARSARRPPAHHHASLVDNRSKPFNSLVFRRTVA